MSATAIKEKNVCIESDKQGIADLKCTHDIHCDFNPGMVACKIFWAITEFFA